MVAIALLVVLIAVCVLAAWLRRRLAARRARPAPPQLVVSPLAEPSDTLGGMWVVDGLTNAFRMFWEVWWALVLGFVLSGIVQAWVPRERLERALGGRGSREVATRDRSRRRVVVVLVRGDRDRQVDVREGREPRLGDDVPVRVDEPRLRARARPLALPRLAVHARRVRRRLRPDRADVARAPAGGLPTARGAGESARRARRHRPRPSLGRERARAASPQGSSRSRRGPTSRTTFAATGRCSGRRSSPAS